MYGGGVVPRLPAALRGVPSHSRGERSRLGNPKWLTCGGMMSGSGRCFFFGRRAGLGLRNNAEPFRIVALSGDGFPPPDECRALDMATGRWNESVVTGRGNICSSSEVLDDAVLICEMGIDLPVLLCMGVSFE